MRIYFPMLEKERFRESLIAHRERHGISTAYLAKKTGVAKTTLDKLVQRKVVGTNYYDAMRIAKFFGKSLEDFVDGKPDDSRSNLNMLINSLAPEEREIVEAQIEGIVSRREKKKK